jgi:branched-chain amino acid transport system ATP-binding protein
MLDEPSLGLSPMMADEMFEHIGRAHKVAGVTVLLVEQRVAESLESCDWAFVLDSGRITLDGQPQTLLRDERIRATYMGIAAVPQDSPGGVSH